MDKLEKIFDLRKEFMLGFAKKTNYFSDDLTLDLNNPEHQRIMREYVTNMTEELFEALRELKGWRHDQYKKDISVDREAFVGELMDAFNFFLSMFVLADVDATEFFNVYQQIHHKIQGRLYREKEKQLKSIL